MARLAHPHLVILENMEFAFLNPRFKIESVRLNYLARGFAGVAVPLERIVWRNVRSSGMRAVPMMQSIKLVSPAFTFHARIPGAVAKVHVLIMRRIGEDFIVSVDRQPFASKHHVITVAIGRKHRGG